MRPNQKRPTFDALLPPRRFSGFKPGMLERSRNIASHVSRRFTERSRQRSVRNNRSDAWNNNGDSSDQMRGELATA